MGWEAIPSVRVPAQTMLTALVLVWLKKLCDTSAPQSWRRYPPTLKISALRQQWSEGGV